MRGASRAISFLADSIFAIDHWRLFRVHTEMQIKLFTCGLQHLTGIFPLNLPVAVPDALSSFVHSGDARSGPVGALDIVTPCNARTRCPSLS